MDEAGVVAPVVREVVIDVSLEGDAGEQGEKERVQSLTAVGGQQFVERDVVSHRFLASGVN